MLRVVLPALLLATPAPAQGFSYTYRSQEDGGRTLVAAARALGDSARLDIVSGDDDLGPGSYLLTTDGGRTLYHVSPARRAYRELSPASFREAVARRPGRVQVSDFSVDTTTNPSCGCQELRWRYRVRVRYLLVRSSVEVEERMRFWTGEAPAGLRNPGAAFMLWTALLQLADRPDLVERVRAAQASLVRGVPLRVELVRGGAEGPRRRPRHGVERGEITEIRPARIDPGVFALPEGYRRLPP